MNIHYGVKQTFFMIPNEEENTFMYTLENLFFLMRDINYKENLNFPHDIKINLLFSPEMKGYILSIKWISKEKEGVPL